MKKKKHQVKPEKTKAVQFTVHAKLRNYELTKAGTAVEFKIKGADGSMLGRLIVGQGTVRWREPNAKVDSVVKDWEQFANLMKRQG